MRQGIARSREAILRDGLSVIAHLIVAVVCRVSAGGRRAGGASRDRTGDLLVANQTLSQLSYGPCLDQPRCASGGSGRSCTPDLTLIRGAL